jgi:hypothetical protein
MVSQTAVKNGHVRSAPAAAKSGIASLGRDCWRLIELQARLAEIDLRAFAARAVVPMAAMIAMSIVSLAALTVGLAGLSQLLAEYTELSVGGALVAVAGVALLLTGIAMFVAFQKLRTATKPLERSKAELVANVRSIAAALHRTVEND